MSALIPGSDIDYDIDFCDVSLQLDSGNYGRLSVLNYENSPVKIAPLKLHNLDSMSANESRMDLEETVLVSDSDNEDNLDNLNGDDPISLHDPLGMEQYISTQGSSKSKSSKTSKSSATSRKTTDSTAVKGGLKVRSYHVRTLLKDSLKPLRSLCSRKIQLINIHKPRSTDLRRK